MVTLIWTLLIYWLVLFVACFVVVEVGHDQLYDEVTPHAGLKVAGGSLLIALVLTILKAKGLPASYESMFTTNFAWTVLQGIVWFGVFTLIFQFHPWHGLGLGIATMLLVTGWPRPGRVPRPRRLPRARRPDTARGHRSGPPPSGPGRITPARGQDPQDLHGGRNV
jgi:hypothetical protein